MRVACAGVIVSCLAGCSRTAVERVEWTVMDTVAALQWKGDETPAIRRAVETTKDVFSWVETLLNAHAAESEIRKLASLSDEEVLAQCSPQVRPCYVAAFRLRDETGGLFNPRWRGKDTLDLGAIAKGYAVDLAAKRLETLGYGEGILVDLGGNLKSVGGTWETGITDPDKTAEIEPQTFALGPGMACATSAEYFRGHHIKDGRTGADSASGVVSVTVIHPDSAMMADGLSTALFLMGREAGEEFLRKKHPNARAIWITKEKAR